MTHTHVDAVTGEIIDAAVKLHKRLGPGLLESVYEMVLVRQLESRGLNVERQKEVTFEFDGMLFEGGFRIDLLVNQLVVVEIKSVERTAAVHSKQVLTYLNLLRLPVGLLLNFGAATMKEGMQRIVSEYYPPGLRVSV